MSPTSGVLFCINEFTKLLYCNVLHACVSCLVNRSSHLSRSTDQCCFVGGSCLWVISYWLLVDKLLQWIQFISDVQSFCTFSFFRTAAARLRSSHLHTALPWGERVRKTQPWRNTAWRKTLEKRGRLQTARGIEFSLKTKRHTFHSDGWHLSEKCSSLTYPVRFSLHNGHYKVGPRRQIQRPSH